MSDFSQIDESLTQTEGTDYKPDPPPRVPGRVLHIDADFLAYHSGYRYEEESLSQSIQSLKVEAESLRIMAGAERAVLHLTMGSKGGRHEIARVQEYQAHRKAKPEGLVQRVTELREFMANYETPTTEPSAWDDQEADDGLAQQMWAAHKMDAPDLHVLWSLDKDLWMVGGLHLNPKTWELEVYPWNYGRCELDDSGSSKKVVGYGTSFFWHQMLMGDTADKIPGLPKLPAPLVVACMPTKKIRDGEARLRKATTPAKIKAAKRALNKLYADAKPKLCGAVTAYEYLKDVHSDLDAFRKVREAYNQYYGTEPFDFVDWRGETHRLTAGDMFVEQARLLWMRRTFGQDVLDWLKEVVT